MTSPLRIVVVTGLSGAGKSTALRVLEDLGYFCVDNLPTPLVSEFARMAETRSDIRRAALGIDARGRAFTRGASQLKDELIDEGRQVTVLYLDASDEVLVRRFSESRRPHPLAGDQDVITGISHEREALQTLRAQADVIIDTSLLNVHQLRHVLRDRFSASTEQYPLHLRLVSFGFRYGLPVDADLVFDVRFLPNPFFVAELKHQAGTDAAVANYVLKHSESREFLDRCSSLLNFLLPLYGKEGKSYLTIALGCTGGRHRSVALVEALAQRLRQQQELMIMHRDIHRHEADRLARQEER